MCFFMFLLFLLLFVTSCLSYWVCMYVHFLFFLLLFYLFIFHFILFFSLFLFNWLIYLLIFVVILCFLNLFIWICLGSKCLLYNVLVYSDSNSLRIPTVTVGKMQVERYGEILRISPYSVRMRENTDQKNLCVWTFFTQWCYRKDFVKLAKIQYLPTSFAWRLFQGRRTCRFTSICKLCLSSFIVVVVMFTLPIVRYVCKALNGKWRSF